RRLSGSSRASRAARSSLIEQRDAPALLDRAGELAHRIGRGNVAMAAIGLVIGLDVLETVAIIDHEPGRFGEALGRDVAEPVQPLDGGAIVEMEARHRIERRVAALGLE